MKDTAKVEILLNAQKKPIMLSGDIEAIKQLIKDIQYGIEYNGSRNPLIVWEANGGKTYINPTQVQVMWYE